MRLPSVTSDRSRASVDGGAQPFASAHPAGWSAVRYVGELWRGEPPVGRLFWTDMLTVGTLVNIAATAPAIALLANGAPALPAFLLHLLPLPYNILLLIAVWQSAERSAWGWGFRAFAAAWFVMALLV